MSLFKYSKPERIDVLKNLRFKFTPATELNDPFEAAPNARILDDPIYVEELISRIAEKEASAEIKSGRHGESERSALADLSKKRIHAEFTNERMAVKAALLSCLYDPALKGIGF